MTAEFIEPTPASRRKLAIFLVAALIGGVALIELAQGHLAELRTRPVCEAIDPFLSWLAFVLGGLLLCAAWVAWMARRALRVNQWPLPGTLVFRRTPIRRGRPVVWRAYAMLAWAILVVALIAFTSYVSWGLIHRVEARCDVAGTMHPDQTLERR